MLLDDYHRIWDTHQAIIERCGLLGLSPPVLPLLMPVNRRTPIRIKEVSFETYTFKSSRLFLTTVFRRSGFNDFGIVLIYNVACLSSFDKYCMNELYNCFKQWLIYILFSDLQPYTLIIGERRKFSLRGTISLLMNMCSTNVLMHSLMNLCLKRTILEFALSLDRT